MSKQPTVYILSSGERGTLYVGVTGNLKLRVWEHREGLVAGFTSKYVVKRLVWYERFVDFPSAIQREKRIKKWNRPGSWNWSRTTIPSGAICGMSCWMASVQIWIPACAGMTSFEDGWIHD